MAESKTKKEKEITEDIDITPAEEKPFDEEAYYNELVPFEAFYDGEKYKDDIFVSVNNKRYQIQRGHKVMIPRKVLLVLENQQKQDRATARMIAREQQKFNTLYK